MSEITTAEIETMLPAFREALAKSKAAAVPLHKHGAFDDLRGKLEFIHLACDALKGLGAMMQPEHSDFQMNMAFSSDAAAVFRFFGEAMRDPAIEAYSAMERLERAAEGELS